MSEKIKARQLEILKYLVTSTIPLEIGFFEEKFQKSSRTIRYDINELRTLCEPYGIDVKYLKKQGFFIPASQKMKCSELLIDQKNTEDNGFFLDTDEERGKKLFLYFFTTRKRVTAEQVAEQFFVSKSTVLRLISKMDGKFGDNIKLSYQKPGGYKLEGEELEQRKIAMSILAEQFKGSYTPEDWYLLLPNALKNLISLQELIQITNGIKKANRQHNIWISNTIFLNLLSYCVVYTYRRYDNTGIKKGEKIYEVSEYCRDLLREVSIPGEKLSMQELTYMEEILADNGVAPKQGEMDSKILQNTMEEMIRVRKEELESKLGKIDYNGLYMDLYGHMKNSLNYEKKGEENETVIEEVKENYYIYYEEALKCADFIEQKLNIWMSETEICYIAVYLYKNCEEKENGRKRVLIVCATGKGLSHLLAIRIERVFPMLKVVGQSSPFQLSYRDNQQDVDFIISTIPLKEAKVPVVKISRILSGEDISRIQEFLDYGAMVDEIPMKYKNKASFGAKADPFALTENIPKIYSRQDMIYTAEVISKLILTLLEYTSKFPQKYQMSQDALLGMIIHMSMAVPRWYEGRTSEGSETFVTEYTKIQKEHKEIFDIMEKFFELVEGTLRVKIPVEEKTAFFLYIIKEE